MSVAKIDNISGVKLTDVNPDKTTNSYVGKIPIYSGEATYVPCDGYKKAAAYFSSGANSPRIQFIKADGTLIGSDTSVTAGNWSSYFDIPNDAVFFAIVITGTSSMRCWVSLIS